MKEYTPLIIGIVLLVLLQQLLNRSKVKNTNKFIFWETLIAVVVFSIILIRSIILKSYDGNLIVVILLYLIPVSYLIAKVIRYYRLMQK